MYTLIASDTCVISYMYTLIASDMYPASSRMYKPSDEHTAVEHAMIDDLYVQLVSTREVRPLKYLLKLVVVREYVIHEGICGRAGHTT